MESRTFGGKRVLREIWRNLTHKPRIHPYTAYLSPRRYGQLWTPGHITRPLSNIFAANGQREDYVERPALESAMPSLSGMPVADLGAGSGDWAHRVLQWGADRVTAVEPSPVMREFSVPDLRIHWIAELFEPEIVDSWSAYAPFTMSNRPGGRRRDLYNAIGVTDEPGVKPILGT